MSSVLPKGKSTVGTTLYSCVWFTDDRGSAKTELWEWEITKIGRPRRTAQQLKHNVSLPVRCTAVVKNKITCKSGDWNWPLIEKFSDIYLREWDLDRDMPYDLFTTPLAAVKAEVVSVKAIIADELHDVDVPPEELEQSRAILAALENRLSKMRASKKD